MTATVELIEATPESPVEPREDDVTAVLSGEIDVSPEHIVKVTQVVRTGILREVTDHGRILPTDKDGVRMTLDILKDMDATALTSSKLNIEEQKANSAAQVAEMADALISKLALGSAPPSTTPRDLESTFELPEVEIVEGELEQGEQSQNPDTWLSDRE